MRIDLLVAEIGSTTTVINAFNGIDTPFPEFIGQGQSPTTVLEGDVTIGLHKAIEALTLSLKTDQVEYNKLLATSSAAGGLKMTVHGLVYDMTAKAAKEAALGAGANIHMVTAGKLRRTDLQRIKDVKPNIILIAGGVDYGERDTAIYNAELIAKMDLDVPILYAGNIENQEEIKLIFEEMGKQNQLYIVENVYPKIDQLNVEPTRRVLQDIFEEHIVHAPGMEHIREMVSGSIIPTPGAVMEASKMLREDIGDLITVDVGGATTDIHSVTEDSDEISRILIAPEPMAKRTVEGDLGVYINMTHIVEMIGIENLSKELNMDEETIKILVAEHVPIPKTPEQFAFVERLTKEAIIVSANRHAGGFRTLFAGGGKKTYAEGKDLTSVKFIIGTGGACTRLPSRMALLAEITKNDLGDKLLPKKEAQILIDHDYIMASLGVLSKEHKASALLLLKKSLRIKDEV
ncbi:GlmL-related ornithine degradation protein [Fusibacter sp. 3D3]|uniref:GlmL-related ornithine degradation protein n=1 Tax=Fusibacter sp. 3D3 TaxID=1048380 RepID=UPI0008535763|nr:GlmL-related ornithine degradation protein [Fusibacter sp. 3D3]GAU76929.1 probable reactivating factor for D-ornithine aminomutase [Fusibacter sp. 3D3]